jgi:NADH:ubiquinone oxidoreductase subunit 6 (subunit J)
MTLAFVIIAVLTLASAVAAMSLRNLVHCVLALTVTFAGLAAFYLQLDAQFIGFAQILVYIGAVAILIVFAILLTQGGDAPRRSGFSASSVVGVGIALAIFGLLSGIILTSRALTREIRPPPEATVRQIGTQLMGNFILPLEVVGLLLTAALFGAVIIAMREKEDRSR